MIRVTEDFSVRNLSGIPKLTPNPLLFHTGYYFPLISGLLDLETYQVSRFSCRVDNWNKFSWPFTSAHGDH